MEPPLRLRHARHLRLGRAALCWVALSVVELSPLQPGLAREPTPESLDPRLPVFMKAKEEQARALTRKLALTVSPEVWKAFELFRAGKWQEATNHFASLEKRNGQYEGARNDATIRTVVWQTLIEISTAVDFFAFGEPKYARAFGDGIIKSIPKESIYFGGTDPGRGLVTALCASHEKGKPFFTITQNALADGNYLIYLREMYGGKIKIPGEKDSADCFNEYLKDAQRRLKSNELKPGEDVRLVDNRVQVSGQVAVMMINGLLAKFIFDRNPEREFYIEESFPLDWMYPYLKPNGLIMKLERKPLAELSEEIVAGDREYWRKYCAGMIGGWLAADTPLKEVCDFADKVYRQKDLDGFSGDPLFVKCSDAQKAFSKLRSSISGVYAWRVAKASSAGERKRMTDAADLGFRQALALCPYSPEAVFRYVNLLLSLNRIDDALLVARTCLKMDPNNQQVRDLVEKLLDIRKTKRTASATEEPGRQEKRAEAAPNSVEALMSLIRAHLKSGETNQALATLDQLLARPDISASETLAAAQVAAQIPAHLIK